MVRFALMHLIATNVSVWMRTLVNEIKNEYSHSTYSSSLAAAGTSNTSEGKNLASCKVLTPRGIQ
jgi:hypothetical protein